MCGAHAGGDCETGGGSAFWCTGGWCTVVCCIFKIATIASNFRIYEVISFVVCTRKLVLNRRNLTHMHVKQVAGGTGGTSGSGGRTGGNEACMAQGSVPVVPKRAAVSMKCISRASKP